MLKYDENHISSPWSRRQIEIISGLTAGFSTTIVTHPLDLIKIRLQLSTDQAGRPFQSIRDVITKIHQDSFTTSNHLRQQDRTANTHNAFRHKPFQILKQYYRGITPNLIGNISAWGLYFSLYAEFKSILVFNNETVTYFASSMLAGLSTSVLTNPIWVLKTRILGTSRSESKAYTSTIDGIRQILRKEGISSFWKGTIPSMFQVLQGSLQFTFYDKLKDIFVKRRKRQNLTEGQLLTSEYLYSSSLSKLFSMVIMYPAQIVKSRMQNYQGENSKLSIKSVIKQLWYHEGKWRAFYKGISANIVRVLPATCITFLAYESMKDQLSVYNTP